MALPVVHRIWFGDAPMPVAYVEFGERWAELGHDVMLWTEQNVPDLANQDIFDQIPQRGVNVGGGNPATGVAVQRADIVSYELVAQFGGIYANCDIEPLRPVDIPGAWAAWERQGTIVGSAIFGADKPGDMFWASCVRTVRTRWFGMPDGIMSEQTGPHLVTAVNEALPGYLTVLDERLFYPYRCDEGPLPAPEGAWTVHHWGHRSLQPGEA